MINELRLDKEARSSFSMQLYLKERNDKLTAKGLLGYSEQNSHPLLKHPVPSSFF